jgi:hypothetical protein
MDIKVGNGGGSGFQKIEKQFYFKVSEKKMHVHITLILIRAKSRQNTTVCGLHKKDKMDFCISLKSRNQSL